MLGLAMLFDAGMWEAAMRMVGAQASAQAVLTGVGRGDAWFCPGWLPGRGSWLGLIGE
jgi:hypothetical protein